MLLKSVWNVESTNYMTAKIEKYTTDRRRGLYLLKNVERILGTNSFRDAVRMHCRNTYVKFHLIFGLFSFFFYLSCRSRGEESSLMESFQRQIFEKSIDLSLTKVIDTWLRADSYPVVTVDLDAQHNEIFIFQEQVVPQNISSYPNPFVLFVNASNGNANFSGLFFIVTSAVATRASDIVANDSRILLNTNELGESCFCTERTFHKTEILVSLKGYYRTNYAPKNWKAIINLLQENYTAIEQLTKATLIDDACNLARNGYLNYSIVFELINASRGHDYLIWKAVLRNLEELIEHASDSCAAKIKVSKVSLTVCKDIN